ncbi:MAG: glutathione S-transferase family protein [Steroidobacteraceae bacterium]
MLTVYGEGRGFRVVWLLEEMGLDYRLRSVDLLADVSQDTEFMAVNPAGYIPALVDGEATIIESIAIMEYLLARYAPSPLARLAADPEFPAYQQFLHLGEAGLMMPMHMAFMSHVLAPENERNDWSARNAVEIFKRRLVLVTRQLARSPYLAGDTFTAADISVGYSLIWVKRCKLFDFGKIELAYIERVMARDGYKRAMAACHGTRSWAERVDAGD